MTSLVSIFAHGDEIGDSHEPIQTIDRRTQLPPLVFGFVFGLIVGVVGSRIFSSPKKDKSI